MSIKESKIKEKFCYAADLIADNLTSASRKMGIEHSALHKIVKGEGMPGLKALQGLAKCGISIDWLFGHTGKIWRDSKVDNQSAAIEDKNLTNRLLSTLQTTLEKEQVENEALKQELVEAKERYAKLEVVCNTKSEAAAYLGSKLGSEIPRPEELDEWSKRREQPDNKDEDSEKAEDKKQRASLKKGR